MHLFSTSNAGTELASTNYWHSEHAAAGLCYLSANAGTWRLLVPPSAELYVRAMRPAKSVTIELSAQRPDHCWDVVFEDGSEEPFSISVDKRHTDRAMMPGACRFAVWTQAGKVLELECQVEI